MTLKIFLVCWICCQGVKYIAAVSTRVYFVESKSIMVPVINYNMNTKYSMRVYIKSDDIEFQTVNPLLAPKYEVI
jgi:hypothetical protein